MYTFLALITPGGWEEGHTVAAWAFDVGEERWRDAEESLLLWGVCAY